MYIRYTFFHDHFSETRLNIYPPPIMLSYHNPTGINICILLLLHKIYSLTLESASEIPIYEYVGPRMVVNINRPGTHKHYKTYLLRSILSALLAILRLL